MLEFLLRFFWKYGSVFVVNFKILCVWIVLVCFFCFNVVVRIDIKMNVFMLFNKIIGSVIKWINVVLFDRLLLKKKIKIIWIIFMYVLIMVEKLVDGKIVCFVMWFFKKLVIKLIIKEVGI